MSKVFFTSSFLPLKGFTSSLSPLKGIYMLRQKNITVNRSSEKNLKKPNGYRFLITEAFYFIISENFKQKKRPEILLSRALCPRLISPKIPRTPLKVFFTSSFSPLKGIYMLRQKNITVNRPSEKNLKKPNTTHDLHKYKHHHLNPVLTINKEILGNTSRTYVGVR